MAYFGLSAQEFADIHRAVAEAMAYVTLPVTFYKASPVAVDPLYNEAVGGEDNFQPYASLRASVVLRPSKDTLTRFGLYDTAVDMLMSIPRQSVLDWEESTGQPLVLTNDMEVEVLGTRYLVESIRIDHLPVGDGSTADYIEIVVGGSSIKPR